MKIKERAKRFWSFLWESESIWSWVALFLIAFALVRFIIFPVLGLVLGGTTLPLVVVESRSMEHQGSFEDWLGSHGEWYFERNFTRENLLAFEFIDGLDKGDIVVTKKVDSYNVGDIIIFQTSVQRTPIIHRIVGYDWIGNDFETKGDNNQEQLLYEKEIEPEQILSKAVLRIPKIGWIKLAIVESLRALAGQSSA